MKKSNYMSKNEYIEFIKLGILAGEVGKWAEHTEDKVWHRKLKTVETYLTNILNERISYLGEKQVLSVKRKWETCKLQFENPSTFFGTEKEKKANRTVEIDLEDLYNLADFALTECMTCPQGKVVQNCEMRELYHRCNLEPTRFDVKEGECEFRFDNEVKAVSIEHRRLCVPIL